MYSDVIHLIMLASRPIDALMIKLTCKAFYKITPRYPDDPMEIGNIFELKMHPNTIFTLVLHGHLDLVKYTKYKMDILRGLISIHDVENIPKFIPDMIDKLACYKILNTLNSCYDAATVGIVIDRCSRRGSKIGYAYEYICQTRDVELFKRVTAGKCIDYRKCMIRACCRADNLDMVKHLVENHGVSITDIDIDMVINTDDLSMLAYCMEKSNKDFSENIFISACRRGRRNIIKLMLDMSYDMDIGLTNILYCNQKEVIDLFIEYPGRSSVIKNFTRCFINDSMILLSEFCDDPVCRMLLSLDDLQPYKHLVSLDIAENIIIYAKHNKKILDEVRKIYPSIKSIYFQ